MWPGSGGADNDPNIHVCTQHREQTETIALSQPRSRAVRKSAPVRWLLQARPQVWTTVISIPGDVAAK
jgi:hypothetical protein